MNRRGFVLLAALCVGLSCTTATDGDENGYEYDQTTVLGTLNLFVDVWNRCDIDTYEGLLDGDAFIFYFTPQDVGGDIPPSWGYEEEMNAVGNLFDTLGAANVDVQLDLSEVTEPEEGVDTYTVRDVPYEIIVYVEDEYRTYLAQERLDMELTKVDGEWVITQWWDKLFSLLPGIECTTWGVIKWVFYEE
jgi:hypothetical protein